MCFACDAEEAASSMSLNYGIPAHKDIRDCKNLPEFDILCAGFPCQPFSKSGSQEGFKDETRGTLFHEIIRIVRESTPKILFLENVPNLESHDGGNTYQIIKQSIEREGYRFWSEILSPHTFGTPQIRKRLYMVAIRNEFCNEEEFVFPTGLGEETNVKSILDKKDTVLKKYYLSEEDTNILRFLELFHSEHRFGRDASCNLGVKSLVELPLENIHPYLNNGVFGSGRRRF